MVPWQVVCKELRAEASQGRPEAVWQKALTPIRNLRPSPADVRRLWDTLFADWGPESGPPPLWWPEPEIRQRANLTEFAAGCGRQGYQDLLDWSLAQPEEFWSRVVDRLDIQFDRPPARTLDLAAGVTRPVWLPDARLNIVRSCFRADPQAPAVISGAADGRLSRTSYDQLRRAVNCVANSVRAAGFPPGARLAIIMPMTLDAVTIYLGVIQAGCVVVSIADSFAAAEIERRLKIAETQGVFCVDCFTRAGKPLDVYARIVEAAGPRSIVLPSSGETKARLREIDAWWSDFLVTDEREVTDSSAPDHHINVLFSSGTTGDPKAIPWNQTTPIKAAADGLFHQDIHAGDVVVWPTNLGWMMGPWLIFASLINRATIGLFEDVPAGASFGRFVQDAGVTMLGVVPTLVRAWRTTQCMEELDWSAIRCFSSTGEASNPDDMFYLSALAGMKPVIEYCGGTEIGGGYITSSVLQPNVAGMFSTPALGSRVQILNEAGQPADEGELFLVPPAIGLSTELLNRDHNATYHEGTPAGPEGETLRRHGDHFHRLPGGYYVAGGRVDDTMNLGGIKTSAAEIEKVLNRLDNIRETAAVAVPAPGGGPDMLVVFAVPQIGQDHEFDEQMRSAMNEALRRELNPLFKVRQLRWLDAMPRTASNKIMRRRLREQVAMATS